MGISKIKKPAPKKAEKINPQEVVEQIPTWLQLLLAKYGQGTGPLVGLVVVAKEEEEEQKITPSPSKKVVSATVPAPAKPTPITAPEESMDWLENIADLPAPSATPKEKQKEPVPSATEEDAPAWLTESLLQEPLTTKAPSPKAKPSPADRGEETPAWLTEALQDNQPVEDDSTLDWMNNTAEVDQTHQVEADQGVGFHDWLSNIASDLPEGEVTNDTPEWLSNIVPPLGTTAPEKGVEMDVPDWLTDMSPLTADSLDSSAVTLATEEAIPSWLGSKKAEPKKEESVEEDLPLNWLGSKKTEPKKEESVEEELSFGWLGSSQAEDVETSAPELTEVPEWLSSADESKYIPIERDPFFDELEWIEWREETIPTPEETKPPDWISKASKSGGQVKEGMPDWIKPSPQATTATQPAQLSPEAEDWLATLDTLSPESTPLTAPTASSLSEADDWLTAFGDSGMAEPTKSSKTTASSSLPNADDWLSAFDTPLTTESDSSSSSSDTTASADDWMTSFGSSSAEKPADSSFSSSDTTASADDWMTSFGSSSVEKPADSSSSSSDTTASADDWMTSFGSSSTEKPKTATAPADSMDWTTDFGGTTAKKSAAPSAMPAFPTTPVTPPVADSQIRNLAVSQSRPVTPPVPTPKVEPAPIESVAEESVSPLRRLKSLKILTEEIEPSPLPSAQKGMSLEMPNWAKKLVPTKTEVNNITLALPSWATKLIPSGATSTQTIATALPAWATALVPLTAIETQTVPAIKKVRPLDVSAKSPKPREVSPEIAPLKKLRKLPKSSSTPDTIQPAPIPASKKSVEPDLSFTIPHATISRSNLKTSALVLERLGGLFADPPPKPETSPQKTTPKTESKAPTTTPDFPSKSSSAITTESETPSWMADDTPTEESAIPDWMSESSPAEITEPETPSWIAETPTKESAIPDWMSEISPTDNAEESSEVIDWTPPENFGKTKALIPDRLSWFTDFPAKISPQKTTSQDKVEMPDKVSDLPQKEAAEIPPWLSKNTESAEPQTPPWMTTPSIPDELLDTETEQIATEPTTPRVIDELEISDWLSGLMQKSVTEELLTYPTPATISFAEQRLQNISQDWHDLAPQSEIKPTILTEEIPLPDWFTDTPKSWDSEKTAVLATSVVEEEPPLPDWMSDFPAMSDESPFTQPQVETEEEPALPDWMSDLPAMSDESPFTQPQVETEEEPALPDWMSDLPAMSEESPFTQPQVETEEEPALSDWMSDLSQTADIKETATPPIELKLDTIESATSLPEWLTYLPSTHPLKELSSRKQPSDNSQEEPSIADWMTDLPSTHPLKELPISSFEQPQLHAKTELSLPDWLTDLPPVSDIEETETLSFPTIEKLPDLPPEPPKVEENVPLPDWLAELPPVSDTEKTSFMETQPQFATTEEPALPDWMSDLPAVTPIETQFGVTEEEPALPDWMSDLPAVTPIETQFGVTKEEPALPDWMSDLPAMSDMEKQPQFATTEEPALPDWMSDLPAVTSIETEPQFGVTAEEPALPDWMSDLPTVTSIETELQFGVTAEEPALPDWMSDLPAMSDMETEPQFATTEEPALPDWMSALPQLSEIEATPTEQPQYHSFDEVPDWLADLSQAPATGESVPPTFMPEEKDWLAELTPSATTEESPTWSTEQELFEQEKPIIPAWLTDQPDTAPETPAWAIDSSDFTQPTQEALETPPWLTESEPEPDSPLSEKEAESPAWLMDLPSAEPETPTWLTSTLAEEKPPSPAWLIDSPEITSSLSAASDAPPPDWMSEVEESPQLPFEQEPSPLDWKADLRQSDEQESAEEETDSLAVPTSLTYSTSIEKIVIGGLVISGTNKIFQPTIEPFDSDVLLKATRKFYEIATQVPQPAALPIPLTRQEKLMGGALRAVLYMLFILLIALPLFPKKIVDGQRMAWTEPMGELGEILAKQRRELISEELGIIDLQPSDAVAVVSFDYTTATNGEMQPLVEAIMQRLRGQGMKIIALSLNPEGAALAQKSMDNLLAERKELYGTTMVNLGYIPGEVAGIRSLITGKQPLSTLADFKENLPLNRRDNWLNQLAQANVIVTFADNPTTVRWWIEQLALPVGKPAAVASNKNKPALLAVTSATADPFLQPYRNSKQLNGLISGISGAAAMEATRQNFGLARQMLDSQSVAHLLIVILIAAGTIFGWMPPLDESPSASKEEEPISDDESEADNP